MVKTDKKVRLELWRARLEWRMGEGGRGRLG